MTLVDSASLLSVKIMLVFHGGDASMLTSLYLSASCWITLALF